jgi:nitroimidazol reductase NimA-like FMN-containing flavoprotein (pyridoxamine 5'-phosphate oxidase superfamily)
MRRAEREIKDRSTIEEILRRATVCRLAVCDGNVPYVVPLSFGYRDNRLYFHSAPEGRKMETIKANPHVCFEVDVDHEIVPGEIPCGWTVRYRSVIGFGKARLLEDVAQKKHHPRAPRARTVRVSRRSHRRGCCRRDRNR